jgi:transcriptional regulator with XRE-family HTH domain
LVRFVKSEKYSRLAANSVPFLVLLDRSIPFCATITLMAVSKDNTHPIKTYAVRRVGKYLAELRRRKGKAQKDVAQALGVDAVTLRRWEHGMREPSALHLERLAQFYGLTVETLLMNAFLRESPEKDNADSGPHQSAPANFGTEDPKSITNWQGSTPSISAAKTREQERLESLKGKPIRQVIVDALEARRGQKNLVQAVAIDLEVSDGTVYAWCREFAIKVSDYAYPRTEPEDVMSVTSWPEKTPPIGVALNGGTQETE